MYTTDDSNHGIIFINVANSFQIGSQIFLQDLGTSPNYRLMQVAINQSHLKRCTDKPMKRQYMR